LIPNSKQITYLILTLFTLVAGYAYLRYAYKVTDSTPFTQEIVLIILGTIATVFITALLLNKQTAVEIEKEQNIRFLELKAQTYERLLDLIEDMTLADKLTQQDITKLQFITHRLSIFASANVLNEYNNFLNVISTISKDATFENDKKTLMNALGKLSTEIRFDLLNENKDQKIYTVEHIRKMINKNSKSSYDIDIGG
jgi:hypothetical protein